VDQAGFRVKELMTTEVVTAAPGQPVEEVARELSRRGLSAVPVLDETGVLVGIVSEYDVVTKRGRVVGDIMSQGVVTITEDADAEQVAALIGLHGIRRLPVLRDGRVVGMISRADLVRLLAETRWVCDACGASERALARPARCAACGSDDMRLVRD